MLEAERVIADYLSTLLLVGVDIGQSEDHLAVLTFDPEGVDDFFDHARGASDPDVLVTHGTVLLKNEPVLYTTLAEELVAIVTLFGVLGYL